MQVKSKRVDVINRDPICCQPIENKTLEKESEERSGQCAQVETLCSTFAPEGEVIYLIYSIAINGC